MVENVDKLLGLGCSVEYGSGLNGVVDEDGQRVEMASVTAAWLTKWEKMVMMACRVILAWVVWTKTESKWAELDSNVPPNWDEWRPELIEPRP